MTDNSSRLIRDLILEIASMGQEGHIASSFSIVEMLISIFGDPPNEVSDAATRVERVSDRLRGFVLSKGHAALGLYAALVYFGVLKKEEFADFAGSDSRFGGHPTKSEEPPIRLSTGSLGHGLPACAGIAFAAQLKGQQERFICLCGDGELNEGSMWEALLLINKFRLRNFTLMVDDNGSSTRAIDLGSIAAKLTSFGLIVSEVDGHDIQSLRTALVSAQTMSAPTAIVARTIKGYGSEVTKNQFAWHHRVPTKSEIENIRNGYYI